MSLFTQEDIDRFHAAAKMIEADGVDAIRTCTQRFGKDIAGALLVAFIRKSEGSMDSWPAPDHVVPNTNAALERHGLVAKPNLMFVCPKCRAQFPRKHECPICQVDLVEPTDEALNFCPRCEEPKQKNRCKIHGGCTNCGWTGVKSEEHITQPCDCLEGLR